MPMFRKSNPVYSSVSHGGFTCTRLVDRTDSSLKTDKVLVTDSPDNFYRGYPDIEVFRLKNKVEAGVKLEEVPSVVFVDDKLSDSEIKKIDAVLDAAPDDEPKND